MAHRPHTTPLSSVMHHRCPGRINPLLLAIVAGLSAVHCTPGWAGAPTLPTGMAVVSGQATASQSGNTLTINNSDKAVLNWQSFSVGSANGVVFQQPNASSQVLNRVVGQDPSAILGTLQSNGKVWLLNPNGVLFGKDARIDVGGLVATTLNMDTQDFVNGRYLLKQTGVGSGSVINQGTIRTPFGGQVLLVGTDVQNSGTLDAPGGQAALLGASQVELVDTGTPFMSLRVSVRDGQVQQTGAVGAGHIDIQGAVINQDGVLRASSMGLNEHGQIVLGASGNVVTSASSLMTAVGGSIAIDADNLASLGGTMSVADATGQGGSLSVGAKNILQFGSMDASGQSAGGSIALSAAQRLIQTSSASLDASSNNGAGGLVTVQASARGDATVALSDRSSVLSSARINVSGQTGGSVDVLADDISLLAATVDAHGALQGGRVRIGGDLHGANPALHNAVTTTVNATTQLDVSASQDGNAGTAVVWSDQQTQFGGNIQARGGALSGNGGFVEVSGKMHLQFAGMVDAGAAHGKAGTLLLDPKNITIDAAGGLPAFQLIDPDPSIYSAFGQSAFALPNGNIVVAVQYDSLSALNSGAVYLFNGKTGALISSLIGSHTNDRVGSGFSGTGVTILSNGNYVVNSPGWTNGSATYAGAATWGSATTGTQGVVSTSNSLVGSQSNDAVGYGISALPNGNYLVNSYSWANGAAGYAGAVTWADGTTGIQGVVSASNSLVGSHVGDNVGSGGFTILTSGNYVVDSPRWANGAAGNAGAVTWGSSSRGLQGVISASNSLVGLQAGDSVGSGHVTALTNGNFVVASSNWANGLVSAVGAVTWVDASLGTSGAVTLANSLVGSRNLDTVGSKVTALSNGNYVVTSINWANGAAQKAGAVTWGNGSTGTVGAVSASNSLVGSRTNDYLGYSFSGFSAFALSNGNYVVDSPYWANGAAASAGAVTWGNGNGGTVGLVSAANSLVGLRAGDQIGNGCVATSVCSGITVLANGNYVVASPNWANGLVTQAGAATWASGTTGIQGIVSAANSLVGLQIRDEVSRAGVVELSNGNYVVDSPFWTNGLALGAGAVTWGSGTTGIQGAVSTANSLVGTSANDTVGYTFGGVTALTNGNYVVNSPYWNNGTLTSVGAVTWLNGSTGTGTVVSTNNSLVGAQAGDQIGWNFSTALRNGNYVVSSPYWANGTATQAGAVTWGSGSTGIQGVVSATNSLVGTQVNDQIGRYQGSYRIPVTSTSDSNYVVSSPAWANGAAAAAGAVTWGDGNTGVSGTISAANSLLGQIAIENFGNHLVSMGNGSVLVGSTSSNGGTGRIDVVGADALSFSGASSANGTVSPTWLTSITNSGTAIVLQANNDITVNAAISTSAGGKGGSITLQAGRSITINADITTDNGGLKLSANDPNAIAANKDAGIGSITMAANTLLNTGNGLLTTTLNAAAGQIALQSVQAGAINASGDITLQGASTYSSFTLSGGSLTVGAASTLTVNGALNIGAGNTLNLTGGAVSANTLGIGGLFNLSSGSLTAGASTVFSSGQLAITGGSASFSSTLDVLSGGTLSYALPGALSVAGAMRNAGSVLINSGTLNANGGYTQSAGLTTLGTSVSAPANLGVGAVGGQFNGGTLGGSGTITGNVSLGAATLAPGYSPGSLSITGNLTLASSSTTLIELGGLVAGTGFDVINVSGSVALGGTLNVSQYAGFMPGAADTFNYLNSGTGVSGSFAAVIFSAPSNAWGFASSQVANSMRLALVAVVPPVVPSVVPPVVPPVAPPAVPPVVPPVVALVAASGAPLASNTSAVANTVGNAGLWSGFTLAPTPTGSAPSNAQSSAVAGAQSATIGYTGTSLAILDITPGTGLPGAAYSVSGVAASQRNPGVMPGTAGASPSVGNSVSAGAGNGAGSTSASAGAVTVLTGAGQVPSNNTGIAQPSTTTSNLPSYRYMVSDLSRVYFRVLPVQSMATQDLGEVLASRKAYKKTLFANAIRILEKNPSLPDLPACGTAQSGFAGTCTVEEHQSRSPTAAVGHKYAVVVGLNQYDDARIPQLIGAVPDAVAVNQVLHDQLGYEVSLLKNASKQEIFSALNQIAARVTENDSVLLYYAGHGEMVEATGLGYWVPRDGSADDPKGWVSNADLNRLLSRSRSKQMVVVSDSCYSGVFAKESRMPTSPGASSLDQLLRHKSVTVMSSGSDEPVADNGKDDHSVFAWNLLSNLQSMQGWQSGTAVFDSVRVGVERELPQSPQYGASLSAGHEPGGDYIFERRMRE